MLLVEDEMLVAMMMKDMLTDLGFSVIGPYSRIAEALPVARANDLEAAVLDINLNGELVYPVAAALVERGVPIVFVTGYGAESIDRQFSQIPVLQKPIERQGAGKLLCRQRQQLGPARTISPRTPATAAAGGACQARSAPSVAPAPGRA